MAAMAVVPARVLGPWPGSPGAPGAALCQGPGRQGHWKACRLHTVFISPSFIFSRVNAAPLLHPPPPRTLGTRAGRGALCPPPLSGPSGFPGSLRPWAPLPRRPRLHLSHRNWKAIRPRLCQRPALARRRVIYTERPLLPPSSAPSRATVAAPAGPSAAQAPGGPGRQGAGEGPGPRCTRRPGRTALAPGLRP